MKQIYISLAILLLILNGNIINAQTVWTGPVTTFTKSNNADWTLEVNQDRITSNVWITRADDSGIFNIVNDSSADSTGHPDDPHPTDTEWAYGTIANYASLTYQGLSPLIGENFSNIVDGQDMVLHLITDDIYIGIKFLSWTSGSTNGGGFSYEHSTDQALSTNEFEQDKSIKLFPNPSTEFIQASGLTTKENYKIFNILGEEIRNGSISNNDIINIKDLSNGLYFLKFDGGKALKFIKENN